MGKPGTPFNAFRSMSTNEMIDLEKVIEKLKAQNVEQRELLTQLSESE
jgi:hypothetical protein